MNLVVANNIMEVDLEKYKAEVTEEMERILSYWIQYTIDETNGGFYGKIDNDNVVNTVAQKGVVLNARILWTFSAAYNITKQPQYLTIADRAYAYIRQFFTDKEYGGAYWSVNYKGEPLDTKKQVYAIAFLLYACSEYFICNHQHKVKDFAIELYHLIQQKSFDTERGGYFEAFNRDWKAITDVRLSAKDANEKKTMNTHLHILESYTNLYRIWPDGQLKKCIGLLIENFLQHIVNPVTHHLNLFFDENWHSKMDIVSYGHDVEAAWLIQEAGEVIGDNKLIAQSKSLAITLATAAAEGLDADGGLWYEMENGHLIKQKHWWPQAEAMVGFFNAWQVSGEQLYLQHSINSWDFIKTKILNTKNGEWFWGINEQGGIMQGEDKVGLWKCPYHNARACMEIIKRIDVVETDDRILLN